MNIQSETIDQIVPALIKARKAFKAAVKDAKNPHFKSAYVSLDGVVDAITDALLDNGIVQTQPTAIEEGKTVLHTRFLHISGQWIGGTYPVHPVKNDPQGEGSALTYARRYALMALAGIAPEDDDGNAATQAARTQQAAPQGPTPEQRAAIAKLRPTIDVIKSALTEDDLSTAAEAWGELTEDEKHSIWIAPTKGGPFTTKERETMKSTEFRQAGMAAA